MNDFSDVDNHLKRVSESFGTPAYVYFGSAIEERISGLRLAFDNIFNLSYAVKSNPNPALLEFMKGRIEYLDVSSIGEMNLALESGWESEKISFTGPGKRKFELEEAIEKKVGELVLESVREAELVNKIAAENGNRIQKVLIRIAPATVPMGFGDQMAGRPSAFGIDIEDSDNEIGQILSLENIDVIGFHIYSGTQCLKADAIAENYRIFMEIFMQLCEQYKITPEKLIFGSGLGIPYHEGDTPLDVLACGKKINHALFEFKKITYFANTELILELGRFLVGEAGYFLTSVINIKNSRGSTIGICDGGLNNHLAASGNFGMIIQRNFLMHKVGGGEEERKYNLVGPLCTSIDRMANGIMLPEINEGDCIAIHSSGSYGFTASPLYFISHKLPKEILIEEGRMKDISRF